MTLEELKVVISAETKGLEKAVSGVKSKMNSLTKTVSHSTQKMTRGFDKLGKSINKSFSGILKLAGLTAGIAGLVRLGKTAIQTASDLEEIQNVVNVTFGSGAGEIDAWAQTTLKSFGLVESEAKDVASTFKAMSNGMGIRDDLGRAMSMQLTELAADLASFRNSTVETTSRALSGVFTGETEALKRFGVVMTQANLEAFALSKGITKAYKSMSQAEQVMLRYQFVMQATADAQGDFARSSNSWANQMRVLRGQWTQFLGVLGTAIKQVLSPLLSTLNNILATVITLTKNLLKLLGINFETTAAQVSSAGVGAGEIAEGLDDATGSAKKLNKEIAGFDELETIGEKLSSGSDGIAAGLDDMASGLDIAMPEITEDKTEEPIFTSFREGMESLQKWFEGKFDPWMVETSTKFADWINDTFKREDDWGQAGTTVGSGLNGIIHAIDTFFTKVDGYNVGKSLGTFFNNLTEKLDWESLGHGWGEKLKTGMEIAIGFLETYDFKKLGENIAKAFDSVDWNGIGKDLATLISDMLLAAMDLAIGLSTGHLGENVSNFVDGWTEGWKGEEITNKFNKELKPALTKSWNDLWSSLETNQSLSGLTAAINSLKEILVGEDGQSGLVAILQAISKALIPLSILAGIGAAIAGIGTAIGFVVNQGGKVLLFFEELGLALIDGTGLFTAFAESWKTAAESTTFIDWAAVAKSIDAFNKSLGIAASQVAAVVAVITTLIAAIITAYQNNEEFRKQVDDFVESVKKHVTEITAELKEFYNKHLKPFVDSLIALIKLLVKEVLAYLKDMWLRISNTVAGMASFLLPIVKTLVGIVSEAVSQTVDVLGDILDILGGIIDFITGIFTNDMDRALNGLLRSFRGFVKGLVDLGDAFKNIFIGIGNVILSVIGAVVNGAITALNKIRIEIPDWVPGLGGKSWGFNLSKWSGYQIPYLADGGVIDNPTVAMLGEYQGAKQNPEIAAPESMIRDIIVNANGEMVNAFYQMATQIVSAIEEMDMSVQIGDDVIAQSAKRGSDAYYRRTGKPMYATV